MLYVVPIVGIGRSFRSKSVIDGWVPDFCLSVVKKLFKILFRWEETNILLFINKLQSVIL